jgi:hypothetical protein
MAHARAYTALGLIGTVLAIAGLDGAMCMCTGTAAPEVQRGSRNKGNIYPRTRIRFGEIKEGFASGIDIG